VIKLSDGKVENKAQFTARAQEAIRKKKESANVYNPTFTSNPESLKPGAVNKEPNLNYSYVPKLEHAGKN